MTVTYFKRFRMEIDLAGRRFATEPLGEGFQIHPWDESLLPHHAEAKYQSFRFEIDAHVFPCLGDAEGCLRLMHEIYAKEGFLPEATWLLSYSDPRDSSLEYCGTIQGIRTQKEVGSIQNVGVTSPHRGRGLGTALLFKSLQGFQAAGLDRAFLEVTCQNEAAVRLYQRLGFTATRTVYKAAEIASAPFA